MTYQELVGNLDAQAPTWLLLFGNSAQRLVEPVERILQLIELCLF